jgi:putative DNA primase/helicase
MTRRHTAPDMPAVAALLAERIAELAVELVGDKPTTRGRAEWRFRSRGSLAVVVAGPKRGSWHDHEAGCGGDALGLVAHLRHTPMAEAWRWALGWLGIREGEQPHTPQPRPVAPPQRKAEVSPPASLDLARRLWREAVAPAGTLVERYLASRGLKLPESEHPLRFHPDCPRGAERWPAMLALMTHPAEHETDGRPRIVGVHRTFLLPDGSGKAPGTAKQMLGHAGVVRLVPDDDVTAGLGIAEGIETSLAVMQGFGWRPVWAATSAGMIRTFPVLAGIEALSIFADADTAGREAAESCGARWAEAGREVAVIAAPAGDFNDTHRERAA